MRKGLWAKRVLPILVVTLVLALLVPGCAPAAPQAGEALPPNVKLVEVAKIFQTEFSTESFRGMKYVGLIVENEAKFSALAEAVTTAIGPVIDAVAEGKATPDDMFGAAIGTAAGKWQELEIERVQAEALAKATAGAATNALAGGARAAKSTATTVSTAVAKGMADLNTVIAVSMAGAAGRSVTVELVVEIENPNAFPIEVGYQWYYLSVAGRQIARIMYPEKMYIPANTTIVVRHRQPTSLLNDIIVPSLAPPLALPIHGATLQPAEPGTGAIETGYALWTQIRIPYEAEKTGDIAAWNKEAESVTPLEEYQIDEYLGAVYLEGKYVSGTTFKDACETANTVTWDVKCELGVHSESGSVTKEAELSWTAGS